MASEYLRHNFRKNAVYTKTLTSPQTGEGEEISAGSDRAGTYLVKLVHVVGQQVDYLARGCLPHGRVT